MGASGPGSSAEVVVRPFLEAWPGAGGRPRRFVDILEDCGDVVVDFREANEAWIGVGRIVGRAR